MDIQLHISTDDQVIGPTCDFTYRWCMSFGLKRKEAVRFTVAVSELISNIIQFAYPTDPHAYFDLTFTHSLSNIELIISEVGEPFDPERHNYNPQKAIEEGNFEGAGFRLIRKFCDEFLFINKGREGKEFRLIKNVEVQEIDQVIERATTQQIAPEKQEQLKRTERPSYSFKISNIQASDAEDIAKLIYRTYGYNYTKEDLYFPKKIEKAVTSNEKMGAIARNDQGDAIGYFAIIKKKHSNIGEVGEAVVSTEFRRKGIMSEMMEFLIETAKQEQLDGLYGKAVTTHPVSQRVNHKYGFVTTALMLAKTNMLKFKGVDIQYPQAVSELIDFLPINPHDRKTVYLPSKYADILQDTYAELSISITVGRSKDRAIELAKKSDVQLNINYSDSTSLIIVDKYGPDFSSVLSEMMKSLENQEHLHAIYLDLPLENPATPGQFGKFEALGFIYCGLAPHFHHNADFLRIQKVNAVLDIELIDVYSGFGKKIKALIADEYH